MSEIIDMIALERYMLPPITSPTPNVPPTPKPEVTSGVSSTILTEEPANEKAIKKLKTEDRKVEVSLRDRLLRKSTPTLAPPITNWRLRCLFSQIGRDNYLVWDWLRSPSVEPHLKEFAELFSASKMHSQAFDQKLEEYVAEGQEDPLDHMIWRRRSVAHKQYKDNAIKDRFLSGTENELHQFSWEDLLSRSAMLLVHDGQQAIDSPFKDLGTSGREWSFEVAITALITMHEELQAVNNVMATEDHALGDETIKNRKRGEGNYEAYYVRRPEKEHVWWSVSEARWNHLSDAMKKKWSHVGWILETDAGEQAPSACQQCEDNRSQCWVYKEHAKESIGQPGHGCARCKSKQLACSLKPAKFCYLRKTRRAS
ncbi:uncharacterized protein K452DRAFT_81648 [Aplosporella prunicola CBS 121167]|uniref:Uncharacterized protein n=1 Tax=Aplosporella prunicola CBS 121167 TaxID=1176127 RepID=A0A6A6B4P0_9PEZI|nr:uncharacterized protein K452DRAFT_81648 [Aplosporella prunicola CBS 121167]KAF2139159.1 hypothetical protein K452DRAFT_81648 [Aplosporella prunicola CBS 121167]